MATITGTDAGETLTGTDGADVLIGKGGGDVLDGGRGNDTYKYLLASDSTPSAYDIIAPLPVSDPPSEFIDLTAVAPTKVSIVASYNAAFLFADTPGGAMEIGVQGWLSADSVLTGNPKQSFLIQGTGDAIWLHGAAGDDVIVGDAANNTITGLGGADRLTGGAGADQFVYFAPSDSLAAGRDLITDFTTGSDKIVFQPQGGNAPFPYSNLTIVREGAMSHIMAGSDQGAFAIDAVGAVNGADLNTGSYGLLAPTALLIVGDNLGDVITAGPLNTTVTGGTGNDTINGSSGKDTLSGGDGDDVIESGWNHYSRAFFFVYSPGDAGGNTISGGTGKDRLSGGGLDTIDGGDGDDVISFGTSATIFDPSSDYPEAYGAVARGGAGNDQITVYGYGATIDGGAGDDFISVAATDRFGNATGGDLLTGGAGADTFSFNSPADSPVGRLSLLLDFETGIDKLKLPGGTATDISIVRSGTATFVFETVDSKAFALGSLRDVNGSDLTGLTKGVYMQGDAGANTLIGGSFNDVILAGDGADVVIGGGGADALFGGPGADVFRYTAVSDSKAGALDLIADFQSGSDKIDLSALAPTAVSLVHQGGATFLFAATAGGAMQIGVTTGVQATDVLTGSTTTPFQLIGTKDDDQLVGGGGADFILGGAGRDILTGGGGADVFRYNAASDSPASAPDVIVDFVSGTDKLDLRGVHTGGADKYGFAAIQGSTLVFVDLGGDGVNDMIIGLSGVTNLAAGDILF